MYNSLVRKRTGKKNGYGYGNSWATFITKMINEVAEDE
jgi:hypothetical protein